MQVAYTFDPDASMESRIGWWRAMHAARGHRVTVLYCDGSKPADLALRAAEEGVGDRVRFVPIEHGVLGKSLCSTATTFYMGYHLWHRTAYKTAQRLHAETPFDLVHQTTYCGYREPGLGWKLGPPFIWGPVGGTQSFPLRYIMELGVRDAWIELCRNLINALQLRFSRQVRAAARRATVVLAATRQAQRDLQRSLGVESTVQLETALCTPIEPLREIRPTSEPLRVLWAGRLRAWKTLPLLLDALAELPADIDFRLRVLGVGPLEAAWRRHARRRGVADRIEWVGWGPYRETLDHYRWADCFAFTSMRDTSGTGLLEALAAGVPLVTVDHQGAADIVTDDCGLRVSVAGPKQTVAGFAEGIERLARDRALLHRLSHGATRRAHEFLWERQARPLLRWYSECFAKRSPRSADGSALRTPADSAETPHRHPVASRQTVASGA
ncbi:MAG: glycosyltransferase family 4 protein [Lacipirellulaceae bacterium]